MKIRTLLLQLSMLLLPFATYAAYKGEQIMQANAIIAKSNHGGEYYPVLEIDASANKQGKANVYRDEYGVCVLISSDNLRALLQRANTIAYTDDTKRPEITPHITLIQGVFRTDSLKKLINTIKEIADNTKATEVVMDNKFVKGGGGNTFLDVGEGRAFFDHLTKILTEKAPPDAPMKQVIDDIKIGEADLTEMHVGGAWRDFNIPGSNRPHITAIYSKQNDDLIGEINQLLTDQDLKILVDNISLVKIDEKGNIYGEPILKIKLAVDRQNIL